MTQTETKENPTELKKTVTLTYPLYLLRLLHETWPKEEIELIKAHYTARGVKAIIKDLNDNQEYGLEIYPE